MARTTDQLYQVLYDLSPTWLRNWSIGQVLLRGLAAVLRLGEVTWDTAIEWLRTDTALSGGHSAWLDAHGEDLGVERYPGETDASYQARAYLDPRGPTPERIKRKAAEAFRTIANHAIDYGEPSHQVADVDLFCDDGTCPVFEEGATPFNVVAAVLPYAETLHITDAVPDVDFFADFDFAAPRVVDDRRELHNRIFEAVDSNRPAGTFLHVELQDTAELAHLVHLGLLNTESLSYG